MRWSLLFCAVLPLALPAGEEPVVPAVSTARVVEERAKIDPLSGAGPGALQAKATVAAAGVSLPPYEAKYTVRIGGIKVGEMTQRLSAPSNGLQSLQTIAHTTGVASFFKKHRTSEISVWRNQGGVVQPLSYSYQYKGRSKEVVERIEFDWRKGEISDTRNGEQTLLPAERGTLDKHLLQLVLRQDLLSDAGVYHYQIADRGVLKQYVFEILGQEQVENRHYGSIECLKIRRGEYLFWVAPRFDYLPVKIENEEGGSTVGTYLMAYQTE